MLRARAGRRRAPALAAGLLALAAVAGCTEDGDPQPLPPPPAEPVRLTFGAWGSEQEIVAYADVVEQYNALNDESQVELLTWPTADAMRTAIEDGERMPDVMLSSRDDLAWLLGEELNQPVDDLLDERGVEFGDGYSRDGLEAFSADARLQCMPYGISPMVVFYNTELVDFEKMAARELPAPDIESDSPRWSFEEFAAAADFATRPRRGTRGVHIEPTVEGLAPFVLSGGGGLFNDDATSLGLSGDGSRGALETTLELLRDPQLTLTEEQLAKAPALTWFERGKLGMIAGYRSLVPHLRQVQGLDFDVLPMPVLGSSATVGNLTGLCLSKQARSRAEAADFLVHATSTDSVARVARTGYLAPANLQVAVSDDFLQPGRLPVHAGVFNVAVRAVQELPLIEDWPALEAAVATELQQLVTVPVLDDLDERTERIDELSRQVLDPEAEPSEGFTPMEN